MDIFVVLRDGRRRKSLHTQMPIPHVALVGTGRVARSFLRDLAAFRIPVTGFVTAGAARAAGFSLESGIPGYTALADLLAAHPETDTALVINSNHQHFASTIEALSRGLHVLCEKPMAPTLAECEQMAAAAGSSRGSLQINFEYIHSKMPRRLLDLQRDGFFGELLSASCTDSRGHWWAGDPDADPASQSRLRRELGGGTVFHCGIHQLDMLRAFFGDFSRVQAFRAKRNSLPFYPDDVPDHVWMTLETADGRAANFEIFHNRAPCWYRRHPQVPVDWPATPGHEFRLSLMGTRASCLADFYGAKLHLFRYDHAAKDTVLERTEDFSSDPQNELHHDMTGFLKRYLDHIALGRGPLVPVSDSLATMRLAFAAEESILRGGPVCL
jgi:predicted dehydrogenase